MGEPFTIGIDCLDYPPPPERKVKVWREMIRAKIKVAPIMVRQKPDLPGRWTVHSGAVAVEAAKLEGIKTVEAVAV
jgi:hypothetical protein